MTLKVVSQQVATVACEWETDDGRHGCTEVGKYVMEGDLSTNHAEQRAKVYFEQQGWQLRPERYLCPDCVGKPTDREDPRADEIPDEDSDEITAEDLANAAAYKERYVRFMSIHAATHVLANRLNKLKRGVNWTGSRKTDMAAAYAGRGLHGGQRPVITDLDVENLIAEFGTRTPRGK